MKIIIITLVIVLANYNGVEIYKNNPPVGGRNITADGYNLGIKYQCVEFVKRYYYEVFDHKMPNSYGHAKDFFDTNLPQGGFNKDRGLFQYRNGGDVPPEKDDIVVYGPWDDQVYGHIAIVMNVDVDTVILCHQNSKEPYFESIILDTYGCYLDYSATLGWLRLNKAF